MCPGQVKQMMIWCLKWQSGAFLNKPGKINFKQKHMRCTHRHQPKWCARHGEDESCYGSKRSRLNLDFYYSVASQESVDTPHPIDHDRAKA